MTDRELLELVVQKVSGVEQKISGVEQKVSGVEQQVSGVEQKISGVEQKVSGIEQKIAGMEQDIRLIKTQQTEHGGMIQSLIHASEAQKAQHDALQMEVAKLSGEVHQGFADITEIQKSLFEMYGQHEVAIRSLQRRPV